MNKYPHFAGCKCGSTEDQQTLTEEHDWWINSPTYHNCFHSYMKHNTRPHTLIEISKLLNLTISSITTLEKRAYKKLSKKLKSINS